MTRIVKKLILSILVALILPAVASAAPTATLTRTPAECSWTPCWEASWTTTTPPYTFQTLREYSSEKVVLYQKTEHYPKPSYYDWGQTTSYRVQDGIGEWSNVVSIEWPPMLRVEGNILYWHGYASNFIVEKKPGPIFYEVLNSHEFTPPADPGQTDTFRVRGRAYLLKWSNEVSITFASNVVNIRPRSR